MSLAHLITEARNLAGDNVCGALGCSIESVGGRACPFYDTDHDCGGSQAVYQCTRCGGYDYGDPGGKAYEECCAAHLAESKTWPTIHTP